MDGFFGFFVGEPAMTFYGLLTYFCIDYCRMVSDNEQKLLTAYLFGSPKRRVQTIASVIGAIVGYAALQQTGDLSPMTAFGVGYVANSVPDILGKRAGSKL